jgi:hypothetical protein
MRFRVMRIPLVINTDKGKSRSETFRISYRRVFSRIAFSRSAGVDDTVTVFPTRFQDKPDTSANCAIA